ncbi:outer membrane beta-barrel domain-containing protein [Bdellovibrio bacteriovorus]|uniref:Outer membrane beta-barrel domain-containing protein n=1 Tax=Bdellovibrio bacteriovorus TaxID=959 RepID=A0A150WU68_BDEBC|nr:outer membrane beta-barrel domain-containing protein [Bdellovibrio bacteriovorus]KYG69941.1 outer membrane beta-barrel domain-containing protein [Bdellovibrio bacteriovorus]
MLKKTLLMIILAASQAFAQQGADTKPATNADQRGSDKLDIKKLEQKYWAAKDDDFSVVQNRRYTKADRFYLTLAGGVPINDPFGKGSITGAQLGYFFNERWGVDVSYQKVNMEDNDSTKQFKEDNLTSPNYNFIDSSTMLSVTYVPLYAKMSFVDKAIIYFDMGISLGVGTTDYLIKKEEGDEKKNGMTYQIGINQQIFFSEHFAIRADFINKFTNEERMKYSTIAPDRDMGSKMVNDTSLMVGITYWH